MELDHQSVVGFAKSWGLFYLIALAIGVPPMLLGIPGDNTYANYAEANRAFWRQTVLPLVNRTARAMSGWLSPAFGGELRLAPDIDAVEALSPEREALWARVGLADFLTDDEKRAAVGYGRTQEGGDRASRPFAKKNREDQARDDQGRWIDEGGGDDDSESEFVPTAGKKPFVVPPPPKAGTPQPQYENPKSGLSGKEGAKDIPSWAKGERPRVGENGDEFAKRVLDTRFPGKKHETGPDSDYAKLKKFGDRNFE